MNDRLRFLISGFFIGIAETLPGISGSTIAVAFGIYERIIRVLSLLRPTNISLNFNYIYKTFSLDLMGLLIFSMILGAIFSSKLVMYLLVNFTFIFEIFLSLSMLLISIFIVKSFNFKNIKLVLFVLLGLSTGFLINQIPQITTHQSFISLILIGAIAFTFFMIPGISGSAILLTFGAYELIWGAVAEFNFSIIFPFSIGCFLSLFVMPKIISDLVEKYNYQLMSFFSGLIFMAGINLLF
tara:strand:+ start:1744 stop:2463 length:720 start_codon:yes stop_codon:yes gene_type:complete